MDAVVDVEGDVDEYPGGAALDRLVPVLDLIR